jgi:hypothetical protein
MFERDGRKIQKMGMRSPVSRLDPADADNFAVCKRDKKTAVENRVIALKFMAQALRAVTLRLGEGVEQEGNAGIKQYWAARIQHLDLKLCHDQ